MYLDQYEDNYPHAYCNKHAYGDEYSDGYAYAKIFLHTHGYEDLDPDQDRDGYALDNSDPNSHEYMD